MQRTLVVALAVALALPLCVALTSSAHQENDRRNETHGNAKAHQENVPLLIAGNRTDASKKAANEEPPKPDSIPPVPPTDAALVAATKWIAVIAAFQLLAFCIQAYFMKKAAEATAASLADSKKAVEEAGRTANAMNRMADSVIVSGREQMRAYVSVVIDEKELVELRERSHYLPEGDEDNPVVFDSGGAWIRLVITNVGNTPAYKVRCAMFARLLPWELPKDFAFPQPPMGEVCARVLGPHQPVRKSVSFIDGGGGEYPSPEDILSHTKGEWVSADLGLLWIYFWGSVFYEDIFHEVHREDICARTWWLNLRVQKAGIRGIPMEDVEGYTYTDEQK